MSFAAKVVVALVVCFVFVALGSVGLAFFLWSQGKELVEASEKQFDRGVAFGRQTDESGCLNEAVTRYKDNRGMAGSIAVGVFVNACWTASRPSEGFCDQVPKPLDVFKAVRWQTEQSRKAGLTDQFGGQIFAQQRAYCDSPRRRAAVNPR